MQRAGLAEDYIPYKQKNAASFSQIEVETIKGIGWELADELRRKIAK